MSVSLGRRDGCFSCSNLYWSFYLGVASNYGWESAGTKPNIGYIQVLAEGKPDPGAYVQELVNEWQGGYSSNDAQIITAEDAANMADALEKANNDYPEQDFSELIDFLRGGSCVVV